QDVVAEAEIGDRHGHRFVFGQTGVAPVVPVDTNLLHHILSNLLGNAVRYSPAGTTISIDLDLGETEFGLTVADEGIGIPEAERAGIFDPFIRGSNVGEIGGTGLGLNIVKRYVELMGGSVQLRPTGRGACFRLRIPHAQPGP
ncbi:MAG TPA: ATP-binding protein, partial [Candidatus Didemnitutus sp.]|nr:ATP-binding protein [Candidatus Didemnitutus sp.]